MAPGSNPIFSTIKERISFEHGVIPQVARLAPGSNPIFCTRKSKGAERSLKESNTRLTSRVDVRFSETR